MFAVYVEKSDRADPMSGVVVGEQPEPVIPEGWVRVAVSHASLNRHDIFTMMGITGQPQPIVFPMILGNDGAGVLDDGSPVAVYPLIGGPDWRGDETLDPDWHVLSEKVPGTFARYVAVPRRNAVPLPDGLSLAHAAVLGTAWLTAYRMLFSKVRLSPGQTVLVQGATGGMATALIQMGRAAGLEVWATSRNREGRDMAERLGANLTLAQGEDLPRKVDAVFDNVGAATFAHSLCWVRRGGTVVTAGVTTGGRVELDLLPLIVDQVSVTGSIMGTRQDLVDLMRFVLESGIVPEIGLEVPMRQALGPLRDMVEGRVQGKVVFTL